MKFSARTCIHALAVFTASSPLNAAGVPPLRGGSEHSQETALAIGSAKAKLGAQQANSERQLVGCDVENQGWVGDGWCDQEDGYNTEECNWDGGDCCENTCVPEKYDCSVDMDCKNPLALYSGRETEQVNTWQMAQIFCKSKGGRLATKAEWCSAGASGKDAIFGGQKQGDQWAPIGDAANEWVQVGTRANGNECKTHKELGYGYPDWGHLEDKQPWESNYILCKDLALYSGSAALPPPVLPMWTAGHPYVRSGAWGETVSCRGLQMTADGPYPPEVEVQFVDLKDAACEKDECYCLEAPAEFTEASRDGDNIDCFGELFMFTGSHEFSVTQVSMDLWPCQGRYASNISPDMPQSEERCYCKNTFERFPVPDGYLTKARRGETYQCWGYLRTFDEGPGLSANWELVTSERQCDHDRCLCKEVPAEYTLAAHMGAEYNCGAGVNRLFIRDDVDLFYTPGPYNSPDNCGFTAGCFCESPDARAATPPNFVAYNKGDTYSCTGMWRTHNGPREGFSKLAIKDFANEKCGHDQCFCRNVPAGYLPVAAKGEVFWCPGGKEMRADADSRHWQFTEHWSGEPCPYSMCYCDAQDFFVPSGRQHIASRGAPFTCTGQRSEFDSRTGLFSAEEVAGVTTPEDCAADECLCRPRAFTTALIPAGFTRRAPNAPCGVGNEQATFDLRTGVMTDVEDATASTWTDRGCADASAKVCMCRYVFDRTNPAHSPEGYSLAGTKNTLYQCSGILRTWNEGVLSAATIVSHASQAVCETAACLCNRVPTGFGQLITKGRSIQDCEWDVAVQVSGETIGDQEDLASILGNPWESEEPGVLEYPNPYCKTDACFCFNYPGLAYKRNFFQTPRYRCRRGGISFDGSGLTADFPIPCSKYTLRKVMMTNALTMSNGPSKTYELELPERENVREKWLNLALNTAVKSVEYGLEVSTNWFYGVVKGIVLDIVGTMERTYVEGKIDLKEELKDYVSCAIAEHGVSSVFADFSSEMMLVQRKLKDFEISTDKKATINEASMVCEAMDADMLSPKNVVARVAIAEKFCMMCSTVALTALAYNPLNSLLYSRKYERILQRCAVDLPNLVPEAAKAQLQCIPRALTSISENNFKCEAKNDHLGALVDISFEPSFTGAFQPSSWQKCTPVRNTRMSEEQAFTEFKNDCNKCLTEYQTAYEKAWQFRFYDSVTRPAREIFGPIYRKLYAPPHEHRLL